MHLKKKFEIFDLKKQKISKYFKDFDVIKFEIGIFEMYFLNLRFKFKRKKLEKDPVFIKINRNIRNSNFETVLYFRPEFFKLFLKFKI